MFGCPESELEKVAGASSTRKTRETFPQSASILAAHTRFANPRFEVKRIQARHASERILRVFVMHSLARRACIEKAALSPVTRGLNSGEPSYLLAISKN